MMTFPDTWEEFEKLYGFNDAEEIYTNNSRLIPSFRVKQWLDHLPSAQLTHPTPSNTLGALDISGLDEEIRCTMCKNPMRTDRGCDGGCKYDEKLYADIMKVLHGRIKELPSVQPEPLSDAYMKAVWTWLLNYQIKAVELKGRYTPYEVLSWVANDWRKEHEGFD